MDRSPAKSGAQADVIFEGAPAPGHLPATDAGPAFRQFGRARAIAVILNPRSHRNTRAIPDLRDEPGLLSVVPRTKPELENAIKDFARAGVEVLAIGGGDGTVRDVLTRGMPVFGDSWPDILLLPKGKTNALALDLGLPGEWPLADALKAAQRGRTVTRRPLIVESLDDPQRRRLGFILGAGVFNTAIQAGQVAHRYGAFQSFAVGVTGLFGVLRAMLGSRGSPWRKLWPMRIREGAHGVEVPHSREGADGHRYFVMFSSLTTFPLGMRPFADDAEAKHIHYLVVDAPLRRVVASLPTMLYASGSGSLAELGVHRGSADEFTLEFDDSFVLDGESFPSGRYRLTTGPVLRFIVP